MDDFEPLFQFYIYEYKNKLLCNFYNNGNEMDAGELLGEIMNITKLSLAENEFGTGFCVPEYKDNELETLLGNVIFSDLFLRNTDVDKYVFVKHFINSIVLDYQFSKELELAMALQNVRFPKAIPFCGYRNNRTTEYDDIFTLVNSDNFEIESRKHGFTVKEAASKWSGAYEFLLHNILLHGDRVMLENWVDLAFTLLYYIVKYNKQLKRCGNCGKYFIPYNRLDTLYCDRISPQDSGKTCKEYGAYRQYQNNIKNNDTAKLYRNIYQQKQMMVRRNPDISEYKDDFEMYKSLTKKWKKDIKDGVKTEQQFYEWLKGVKEKKVLDNGNNKKTR